MTEVIERTEIPQPEPAYALGDLLGVPVPDLGNGAGLPPLWHWVYLLDRAAQAGSGCSVSVRSITSVTVTVPPNGAVSSS